MQFCHFEIFFNHWHKVHFDWYTFYDFIFPGHHTSPYLTQYLLERLLASSKNHNKGRADPSQLDRKALEARRERLKAGRERPQASRERLEAQ